MNMIRNTLFGLAAAASIAASAVPAAADRYDRNFELRNYSGYAITGVYVTNVDDSSWRSNLLDGYAVYSGNSTWLSPLRPNGYCLFDVRIEYADGYVSELWSVDLCQEHMIIADPDSAFVP